MKLPFASVVVDINDVAVLPYPECPAAYSVTVALAIGCCPPWTLPERITAGAGEPGSEAVFCKAHPLSRSAEDASVSAVRRSTE